MTERILFSAEHKRLSDGGRIVRTNLTTDQSTDLYTQNEWIYDMAILNEHLLILERYGGIKAVPKDANGNVASQQVNTNGLENCSDYYSIHVVGTEGE